MTAANDKLETTPEERLWAAFGHASGIFMALGTIIPAIVWATQRGKSRFASFQAIQAIAFQILFMLAYFGLGICSAVGMFGFLAVLISTNPRMDPDMFMMFPMAQFGFMGAIFGFMGFNMVVSLIAAGLTLAGNDFRYPILGSWLERYMNQTPQGETI